MKTEVLSFLPPAHPWRDSILWFETVDSTNVRAKALAASGAPQGTVVMADSQSAGRGRLGRSFQSPPGAGIYMSVILRPQCPPSRLMHLTCAVAAAICGAVEDAAGFLPGIKWINDLVAGQKKLAGILTELSIGQKSGLVDYAVVGIGINCSQRAEDFPPELRPIACSAAMAAGHPIDRSRLAAAMICSLEKMSRVLLTEKDAIMARYRENCVTLGREIAVLRGQERRTGKALDVNSDGALLVEFSDGTRETVNSGEVSVRGLFGYA